MKNCGNMEKRKATPSCKEIKIASEKTYLRVINSLRNEVKILYFSQNKGLIVTNLH